MSNKYDYVVIGSGPAGYVSAVTAAQRGLKTAVIEKDENMVGGACLNEGCIPAKSLLHSAEGFSLLKSNADLYGITPPEKVDLRRFVEKSRIASDSLRKGVVYTFKKNGIALISGTARFVDKHTVQVSEKDKVQADKFLVATGSVPRTLQDMPFDGKRIINSSDAIRLEVVPGSILIIGGGAIGCEFASYFRAVGSDVTISELEQSILPGEDKEIARRLETLLKKDGINVFTGSGASAIKPEKYDVVLVSIGRVPVTQDLGLEVVGVKTDDDGFIIVDESMRTTAEGIYAAGDVIRGPMLAHVASCEGGLAAESAAGQAVETIDYTSIPSAVYTKVQVASVGMTEEKAKAEGADYAAAKQFFKANGRAVANCETDGFIKVVADKNTGKLLGVHIIGHEAAELIHEFVVAKKAGLTAKAIARTVHAHPTFSEIAVDVCSTVQGRGKVS